MIVGAKVADTGTQVEQTGMKSERSRREREQDAMSDTGEMEQVALCGSASVPTSKVRDMANTEHGDRTVIACFML